MKFKKIEHVVEATPWFENGDHPEDYLTEPEVAKIQRWGGKVVRRFRRPDLGGSAKCCQCSKIMDVHGWIDTLQDGITVCPGDWIVTGIAGEYYPVKPHIFPQLYKRAPEEENE